MSINTRTARQGPGRVTVAGPRPIDTTRTEPAEQVRIGAPVVPVPITWGGHTVNAPGFDQDRFDRAMARAFVDDLQIKPLRGETFLVHYPGATHGHRVTRETCSCPAGQHDVPCKHRALVIAHLDIRMPEAARRWARRARARQVAAARAEAA
jgi:hypothetical protein